MGNKQRRNLPPRHARHQKERNPLFDDRRPEASPGFGIRRPLSRATTRAILTVAQELQRGGDIAPEIVLRHHAHVTLLPRRNVEDELRKGNGRGRSVGAMAIALEKRAKGRFAYHTEAAADGAGFVKGKVLGIWVVSNALEREKEDIGEVLSWFGMPGIARDLRESRLHISIGESQDVLPLSVRDCAQQALVERLADLVPVAEDPAAAPAPNMLTLPLGRAHMYPEIPKAA